MGYGVDSRFVRLGHLGLMVWRHWASCSGDSSRGWSLDGKAFAEGYILGRPPRDSKTPRALRSEPKLTIDSSSLACPCCSSHSSFYDNCSDTICIYENHINFTRASGIAYKSIFFTSVERRKQQQPFAHRKQKENFAPVLIRKAQWHTFWNFHIFPLLSASSLKEDFILLTQQILFSFPKEKTEKMMLCPHAFTGALD